jgi:serine protease Do
MFSNRSTSGRGGAVAIVALAVPALLAGCVPGPAADTSTDFDGVQSATIQLQAEGTFISPGTLDPVESGSRGSGFFIDGSGIAVTNNHVVTGAGTLKIWVGGDTDRTYGAKVLGASECLDLAVVQVDGSDFPHMDWYEGDIEAALDVYAAGFPLGDPNFTLTRGIVSKADIAQDFPWASLDHVIEHDARIRGGNSGGPLVTEDGTVIGVNYAGNDALDYSWALHRDEVLAVVDDLTAGKPVLTIGANAEAIAPDEQGRPLGVWIASVKAGGPADKAGIRAGDVIETMGGVTLGQRGTLEEYCEVIRTQGVDGVIDVTVYRPSNNGVYEGQINGSELELVEGGNSQGQGNQPTPVGSFVTVTDDSKTVAVSVPDTWTQVLGVPTEANGVQFANVTASPDIASFNASWNTPGVSISATENMSVTVDQYLESFNTGLSAECTDVENGDYDDGLYAGKYLYFTGCGGVDSHFLALVTTDVTGTHQLLLTLQMVSESDKTVVLDQILSTFEAVF